MKELLNNSIQKLRIIISWVKFDVSIEVSLNPTKKWLIRMTVSYLDLIKKFQFNLVQS